MNEAHWHLLLNHFPIEGVIIGLMILSVGFLIRKKEVKHTALSVFMAAAIIAIPASKTGHKAEHFLKKLDEAPHELIEEHEDLGEIFMYAAVGLGLISLITLVLDLRRSSAASVLYGIIFVTAIAACTLAVKVGTTGGKIRHTEIRNEAILSLL